MTKKWQKAFKKMTKNDTCVIKMTAYEDLPFYGNQSIAIAIDRLKCYHGDPGVDLTNVNRGAI